MTHVAARADGIFLLIRGSRPAAADVENRPIDIDSLSGQLRRIWPRLDKKTREMSLRDALAELYCRFDAVRIHSFTIYRRSRNPRPSKIAGIAFSIRAVRVPGCFAPAK